MSRCFSLTCIRSGMHILFGWNPRRTIQVKRSASPSSTTVFTCHLECKGWSCGIWQMYDVCILHLLFYVSSFLFFYMFFFLYVLSYPILCIIYLSIYIYIYIYLTNKLLARLADSKRQLHGSSYTRYMSVVLCLTVTRSFSLSPWDLLTGFISLRGSLQVATHVEFSASLESHGWKSIGRSHTKPPPLLKSSSL